MALDGIPQLLRHVLGANGHTVLAAADGIEALELCERHQGAIDAAITDIVMPGISGPDLARRLRTRLPDVKLLFMSGYNELHVAGAIQDTGASFISKPFSTAALLDKVAELLDA